MYVCSTLVVLSNYILQILIGGYPFPLLELAGIATAFICATAATSAATVLTTLVVGRWTDGNRTNAGSLLAIHQLRTMLFTAQSICLPTLRISSLFVEDM